MNNVSQCSVGGFRDVIDAATGCQCTYILHADGTVDVMMCSPDGFAELWFGKLQPGRLDLITDAVARTRDAKVSYTAGRRLYGNVEGKLLFSFDRATEEHELQPYIWATLERR